MLSVSVSGSGISGSSSSGITGSVAGGGDDDSYSFIRSSWAMSSGARRSTDSASSRTSSSLSSPRLCCRAGWTGELGKMCATGLKSMKSVVRAPILGLIESRAGN